MPSSALQHRVSTGCFVGTLIFLLRKKAESYGRVHQYRGLKLRRNHASQAIAALLFALLVVHGVERNPGPPKRDTTGGGRGSPQPRGTKPSYAAAASSPPPPTEPTLADVMAKLTSIDSIRDDLHKIGDNVETMKHDLKGIKDSVTALQREVDTLQKDVSDLELKNRDLQEQNSDLQEQNRNLTERVLLLERNANGCESNVRKNNVIVHGLKRSDSDKRDWDEVAVDFLSTRLGVGGVILADAHPLGTSPNSPLLLKCVKHKDKVEIMKAKRKLKGTEIKIKEDLPPKVREIRSKLWLEMQELKKVGHKVRMRNDHLIVNEKRMYLDDSGVLYEKND